MTFGKWGQFLIASACAGILVATTLGRAQQAPGPAQGPAPPIAGRAGGRGGGGVAPALFTLADINKDGAVTRAELMTLLEKWFSDSDTAKTGLITSEQLLAVLTVAFPAPVTPGGGGRGVGQDQTPNPADVEKMMAALPDKAIVRPAKPRKVLVLGKAQGFVHSSIPLAAKTVDAIGNKTGAWATTITYDSADINTKNLAQFDVLFLDSTTGCFLDEPGDPAATADRRAALLAFVRAGKGIAGIHAATDSYHGTCPNDAPADGARGGRGRGAAAFGPGSQLQQQIVTQADKNTDQKLSLVEMDALAAEWFDKLDTDKSGKVSSADFVIRFAALSPAPAGLRGGRGSGNDAPVARGSVVIGPGSWPEFNTLIGGFFKFHWLDPQLITVKIDDPKSPLTRMFNGKEFEMHDETYTFAQNSFSRDNVHVLTSIDYDKMSAEDKAKEPVGTARTDGDYALSYIRREGLGRVFYEAHGHHERNYAIKPFLEHIMAGIQYAAGDLKADDKPSGYQTTAAASKKK